MIAGLFPLVNSEGVPLDVVLAGLQQQQLTPDWIDFFRAALRFGWNRDATLSRVEQAVQDTLGADVADVVVARLRGVFVTGVDQRRHQLSEE